VTPVVFWKFGRRVYVPPATDAGLVVEWDDGWLHPADPLGGKAA
jgi:hypothetical protein